MSDIHERKLLSFDEIWAILQEGAMRQKETERMIQETSKELQEIKQMLKELALQSQDTDRRMKETDKQIKETGEQMKETDKQMKETDRKISKLGSRLGQLVEHFAAANLIEKFKELGIFFTRISRNHLIKDAQGRRLAEIDLLLENEKTALVAEVKSLFTYADVKDHLKRMGILRKYAHDHQDSRTYAGAIAGAILEGRAREFALERGLYVIEQAGDNVRITVPAQPAAW